jgi:hypothetical protein
MCFIEFAVVRLSFNYLMGFSGVRLSFNYLMGFSWVRLIKVNYWMLFLREQFLNFQLLAILYQNLYLDFKLIFYASLLHHQYRP